MTEDHEKMSKHLDTMDNLEERLHMARIAIGIDSHGGYDFEELYNEVCSQKEKGFGLIEVTDLQPSMVKPFARYNFNKTGWA